MNILQALLGEHAVFYAQFGYLEQILPTEQDLTVIRNLGGMLGEALASHASLENEILFALLEECLGPLPPVMVMRMEHDQIDGGLAAVAQAETAEQARSRLLDTIAAARVHFAKEEQVLFPLAANRLPPEELQRLGAAWAAARNVTLGGPLQ